MDESIRLIVLARKYNVGLKTIVDFLNRICYENFIIFLFGIEGTTHFIIC